MDEQYHIDGKSLTKDIREQILILKSKSREASLRGESTEKFDYAIEQYENLLENLREDYDI